MLFADKGFWDVLSEQGAAVVAVVLVTLGVAFLTIYYAVSLLKWLAIRYVDPLIVSTQATESHAAKIVDSNANIVGLSMQIVESNKAIVKGMDEWPSDLAKKLDAAKCFGNGGIGACHFPMLTRDEAKALLAKIKVSEESHTENPNG